MCIHNTPLKRPLRRRRRRRVKALIEPKNALAKIIDGWIPRKAWYEREREICQKVRNAFWSLVYFNTHISGPYLSTPPLRKQQDGWDGLF